jgi:hypothetical protein
VKFVAVLWLGCALSIPPIAGFAAAPPPTDSPTAQYIGTAKMLADGSIEFRLYSTSDGKDAHFFQILHKGDALYAEVIAHVGGLKPGETKLVAPWPDDAEPAAPRSP